MRLSTVCLLIALLASASAAAQESFPATHLVRFDIVEPNPGAGTIGGVAIIAINAGEASQIRVTAMPQDDMPDTLFLLYRSITGNDIILSRIPFPANSPTVTASIDLLTPAMRGVVDSGNIWMTVHRRSNHSLYAEGQVQSIPSAVAPEPSGEQVVPPVTGTDGVGHCGLTYDPVENAFRYTAWWLDLSGPPTSARIRRGAPGSDGELVFDIPLTPGAEQSIGIWPNTTEADRHAILNGEYYFEVTTAAYPDGEIRGQIYPVEGFTAAIEPENEVPPITGLQGSGSAFLLITAHGTIDVFNKLQGVVGRLSGPITAAHIHRGVVGESGDPVVTLERPSPVTIDLELASGSAGGAMSDEIVEEIRAGRTYINVHTAANQNGEARGQLIPARTRLLRPTGAVPPATAQRVGFAASYNRHDRSITFTTDAAPANRRIEIYGADGRLVRSVTCEGARCGISAEGLPAGAYFASLRDAGGSAIAACSVMVMP